MPVLSFQGWIGEIGFFCSGSRSWKKHQQANDLHVIGQCALRRCNVNLMGKLSIINAINTLELQDLLQFLEAFLLHVNKVVWNQFSFLHWFISHAFLSFSVMPPCRCFPCQIAFALETDHVLINWKYLLRCLYSMTWSRQVHFLDWIEMTLSNSQRRKCVGSCHVIIPGWKLSWGITLYPK